MSAIATQLDAAWVAEPVLAHASAGGADPDAGGVVLGSFGSTVHAELDGFVVVIQPEAAPRLPNGIGVPRHSLNGILGPRERVSAGAGTRPRFSSGKTSGWVQAGDATTLRSGRLQAGELEIVWETQRPPAWSAAVQSWPVEELASVVGRARAILAATGRSGPMANRTVGAGAGAPPDSSELRAETRTELDPPHSHREPVEVLAAVDGFTQGDTDATFGLECLLLAAQEMDPQAASEAAGLLVGRGSGLTPVGDDILAAAALTLSCLGCASGRPTEQVSATVAALLPAGIHLRTTPISATLLELACRGEAIGPARALLDSRPMAPQALAAAVRRLSALGHSTGAAYVNTIGALMAALAACAPSHPEKELVR